MTTPACASFFQSKEGKRLLRSQWLRANSRIWGVVSAIWQQALAFQTPDSGSADAGQKRSEFYLALGSDPGQLCKMLLVYDGRPIDRLQK